MSPRLLLALAFALGAVGGCFLSPNVPPSFRYRCKADADCMVLSCLGDLIPVPEAEARGMQPAENCELVPDGEDSLYYEARQVCRDGLCEYPCDITRGAADCPSGKGYNFCFNGACATACGNDLERYPDPDATCSSPQRCIIFGEDIELALLEDYRPSGGGGGGATFVGGGGGGGFDVEDYEGTGICGVRCDDDDALPCPPGQYCSGAMCLPDCAHPDATPCAEGRTCFSYGQFSTCLVTCDPNATTTPCDEDEVCVVGLGICLPTCVGETGISCRDGYVCDEMLKICVPEIDPSDTDTGTSG